VKRSRFALNRFKIKLKIKTKKGFLKQSFRGFGVFVWVILSSAAFGYAAAPQDARDNPGAEQARFEEAFDLEEKTRQAAELAPAEPIQSESPELVRPKSDVTFELKKIVISGNDSIPAEELESLSSGFLSKTAHYEDLQTIARSIKQYYREQGFIAAYVYLPPQNITSGSVEIAVIEGVIGKIEVKGNKWFSEKLLKRMLNISAGSVLFYDNLRGALNFLNKNRDIKAKAVLKPGQEAKTTDLEVNVTDRFPLHVSTDVNNLGTDNTGKTRWGIGLTHTNVLGLMDEASGRFQIGRHSWSVGANYTLPVSSYKTALTFSYNRSSVDLGGPFKALDVEGQATTYGLLITQPVIDKQHWSAGVNTGFDWKSIQNTVAGSKSGVDELRIFKLGLNLEQIDRWGRTIFPQNFHFGFSNFLGSSDHQDAGASRAGTGGQFFIYRSNFLRYQKLPKEMILAVRGSLQLTPDNLPPSEQLSLGGAFSVRGYQEGTYLSDSGAFLAHEVYIPTYFFPADWKLPYASKPLRKQIMGVAFYDFGGGALRGPQTGEQENRFLSGVGGGVRIELIDRVYGRFQWGAATASAANDSSKSAFYFGVSSELF